jgi:hypothetical protein
MSATETVVSILDRITITGAELKTQALPKPLALREELGLVTACALTGQCLYSNPYGGLFEIRATPTPRGDYLLMFPDGLPNTRQEYNGHYGGKTAKVNVMRAFRSKDRGKTWSGPVVAHEIDYNQHGFIPLIPRGSKRIYSFGTQPVWNEFSVQNGQQENAPIGCRYSDDDGHTWSDVTLIRPVNDPGYKGMSVMRMCETDTGVWLLGTHTGDWSCKPVRTRQYVLRSADQGKTWTLLPGARHDGWFAKGYDRMDEGRPVALGNGKVLFMARTCEGHLWAARSSDDGLTWSPPAPTPLVHPDAPPMLFPLSDGKTLATFHHNAFQDKNYTEFGAKPVSFTPRGQLWVSFSTDGGEAWTEPRFVLVNARVQEYANEFPDGGAWWDHQCSYLDAFSDDGVMHLFLPHKWHRALYLRIPESELFALPTAAELG